MFEFVCQPGWRFLWERLLSPFCGREIEATHYSLARIEWLRASQPCDYFVAIFQVAQNRLKFGMSTLFTRAPWGDEP